MITSNSKALIRALRPMAAATRAAMVTAFVHSEAVSAIQILEGLTVRLVSMSTISTVGISALLIKALADSALWLESIDILAALATLGILEPIVPFPSARVIATIMELVLHPIPALASEAIWEPTVSLTVAVEGMELAMQTRLVSVMPGTIGTQHLKNANSRAMVKIALFAMVQTSTLALAV